MDLLIMGTVALDSLKTPHGEKQELLGGSAAHCAMSSRHFCPTHISAVVGADFPRKYLSFFKTKNINIDALAVKPGCTFRWQGEYTEHDLNTACTLATTLGVIADCMPQVTDAQKHIKHVFLANYDPDVQYEFLCHLPRPDFVGMDTMNLWINTKKDALIRLVKKVDMLILNDAEAKAYTGEKNLLTAAKRIIGMGPKMVIIKKGEHGGIFYSKQYCFALPAYPLEKVVDPTGAGDTFAGGVMGYLAKVKKIDAKALIKAVSYGTILSSFNVEGFGMEKTKNLTLDKVHERMKIFREFFRF